MTDATKDQTLREMAAHRGFKLVKSRRRKVGAGDYGKYGLTDVGGKPLLGISDEGLTASLEDIEAFLRKGATNTWKASADAMPSRPASPRKAKATNEKIESTIRPRARRSAGHTPTPAKKIAAKPASTPEPAPLRIRAAKSADAADMVVLLRQLDKITIDESGVVDNLERVAKAGGGTLLAILEGVIGGCSWALIPTLHHGLIGRITLLLVDEGHRRKGIATAMLDAATRAMREAACTRIEVMSDIAIKNAHNFFRTSAFEQTSYRFVRAIDAEA